MMRKHTEGATPSGKRKGFMKGQAVMEYLITYGLALFVILIVLGIIFAVVLPMLKAPAACTFSDPNFDCSQKAHALVADSGNNVRILFQLDNKGSRGVEIIGVLCTMATAGNIKKDAIPDFSSVVPVGAASSITAGGTTTPIAQVDCIKEDGTKFQAQPGSNFKGSLAIEYRYSDEIPEVPTRISIATVTGTVQGE